MKCLSLPGYILLLILTACFQTSGESEVTLVAPDTAAVSGPVYHPEGKTIETRYAPPAGYERIALPETSFGAYLRKLPLKPEGSMVLYYDGRPKETPSVYDAVIDLPIGKKDLHQCADAVMRLRAEYLYSQQKYDAIHFNFNSGFRADFSQWRSGKRIAVNGNNVRWVNGNAGGDEEFWKYLETVFTYAGSLSLSKELEKVELKDLNAGDVFIVGGSPGHVIIVVDVAKHKETGKKIFMTAQSYMPAQEIQLLKNPEDPDMSPWYSVDFGDQLVTPQWIFDENNLKRFPEE